MTVVAIKDGILAIDRCVSAYRNDKAVSKKPQTKMLEFSKDIEFTIKGEVIQKAFVSGDLSAAQAVLTNIHATQTAKSMEQFLEMQRLYSQAVPKMHWYIPSSRRPGLWWVVGWVEGTILTVPYIGSHVSRPVDAKAPELEKWFDTPEEIVWFYNKLSKACGFGVNIYNPWTGVLEQIDSPTPEVAEKIRQTLIRSIDIWFLQEPEPGTELSAGDKELVK